MLISQYPISVEFLKSHHLSERFSSYPFIYNDGKYCVEGETGWYYKIQIMNTSNGRIEVCMSVDGLSVIDGKLSSILDKGYVLSPSSSYLFSGWRTSLSEVSPFKFSSQEDSYAEQSGQSNSQIGDILIKVYEEKISEAVYVPYPFSPPYNPWTPYIHHSRTIGNTADNSQHIKSMYIGSQSSFGGVSSSVSGQSTSQVSYNAATHTRLQASLGTEFSQERCSDAVGTTTFIRRTSWPATILKFHYMNHQQFSRLQLEQKQKENNQFCQPPSKVSYY